MQVCSGQKLHVLAVRKQLLGTANRRLIKTLSNPRTNAVLSAQPNLLYAVNRRVVGLRSNGAVVNECPVDIQSRDRLFRLKSESYLRRHKKQEDKSLPVFYTV